MNLREVTRYLNIDYDKLKRSGQVEQLLKTGVTRALPVKIQSRTPAGQTIHLETTARLTVGYDREGKRNVQIALKRDAPKLDTYKDVKLTMDQQKDLQKGRTILLTDDKRQAHIVKFDRDLNQVGGMKKSQFIVPERVGAKRGESVKLTNDQKANLKQGKAVELDIGGKKMTAQLDPIERKLDVGQTQKQKQEQNIRQDTPSKKLGPKL